MLHQRYKASTTTTHLADKSKPKQKAKGKDKCPPFLTSQLPTNYHDKPQQSHSCNQTQPLSFSAPKSLQKYHTTTFPAA